MFLAEEQAKFFFFDFSGVLLFFSLNELNILVVEIGLHVRC